MSRLAREELSEDYLDDEAMTLLMDKESCMGVLSLSHDAHIGKILKLEDEARNLETKEYQNTVHGNMAADRARNRARVLEIHEYVNRSVRTDFEGYSTTPLMSHSTLNSSCKTSYLVLPHPWLSRMFITIILLIIIFKYRYHCRFCRSSKLNINALLINDEDAEDEEAQ